MMKLTPDLYALASAMRIPIFLHGSLELPFARAKPPSLSFLPSGRTFSTTPRRDKAKRESQGKKDLRIKLIRYHLFHPKTPSPLRFSRLRTLRHWTIHRAAQLLLHKDRRARERELERQYNAMRAAMEELRLGIGDGGRLYRQAMDRKGIYGGQKVANDISTVVGNGGVPIEYARAQTEGPPRHGWDNDWTRG